MTLNKLIEVMPQRMRALKSKTPFNEILEYGVCVWFEEMKFYSTYLNNVFDGRGSWDLFQSGWTSGIITQSSYHNLIM